MAVGRFFAAYMALRTVLAYFSGYSSGTGWIPSALHALTGSGAGTPLSFWLIHADILWYRRLTGASPLEQYIKVFVSGDVI